MCAHELLAMRWARRGNPNIHVKLINVPVAGLGAEEKFVLEFVQETPERERQKM